VGHQRPQSYSPPGTPHIMADTLDTIANGEAEFTRGPRDVMPTDLV
jgi:hypothetical protein